MELGPLGLCPPLPLAFEEVETAFYIFRSGGSDEKARRKRKRVAAAMAARLRELHLRVTSGEHVWSAPVLRYVGRRPIAVPHPEDAIVLGACSARLLRHPELPRRVPFGYAYVGRGVHEAVRNFREGAERLAEVHGEVVVVTFDLRHAFRSLDPFRALNRLERWGFSKPILEGLRGFYQVVHCAGFAGCHEGPATSPLLADVALAPMDAMLASRAMQVGRYSDNIFSIYDPDAQDVRGLVEQAIEKFNRREGVALATHGWEVRRFVHGAGFVEPALWLSHFFCGETARPSPAKVMKAHGKVRALVAEGKIDRVQDLVAGLAVYFKSFVPEPALEEVAESLWATARAEV